MNGNEARTLLEARPLDLLEASEAESLTAHLSDCERCTREAADLDEAYADLLADVDAREAEAPLTDALRARILEAVAAGDGGDLQVDVGEGSKADAKKKGLAPAAPPATPTKDAEELGIKVKLSCAYCHSQTPRDEVVFCATCLAPHHGVCFSAHGRCSTMGCEETRTVRPGAPQEQVPPRKRGLIVPLILGIVVGGGSIAALTSTQTFLFDEGDAELVAAGPQAKQEEAAAEPDVPTLGMELEIFHQRTGEELQAMNKDVWEGRAAEARARFDRIEDLSRQAMTHGDAELTQAAREALAQATKEYGFWSQRINLDVEDVDLSDVCEQIGRTVGLNVLVDPAIEETVSISLREIPWAEALMIVARMTRCRIEDRGGRVLLLSQPPRVTLQFTDANVRTVLQLLAKHSGRDFAISPDVRGNVTMDLKEVHWDVALMTIVRTVGDYQVWMLPDGVVSIMAQSSGPPTPGAKVMLPPEPWAPARWDLPTPEGDEPVAPEADGPLGHVVPGQTYLFDMPGAGVALQQRWTVTQVDGETVLYETSTIAAGQPVGEPVSHTFQLGPMADPTGIKRVTLAGRTWQVREETSAGVTSWLPVAAGRFTFPPYLKVMKGDAMEVQSILRSVDGPRTGSKEGPLPEPAGKVDVGQPFDLDVTDADLGEVLEKIAANCDRVIVADPNVSEKVTVLLKQVHWPTAVQVVARMTRCEVEDLTGGVLMFTQPPKVTIQFTDANVRTVLQLLAAYSGKNVVISPMVRGSLTLDLKEVHWRSGLLSVVQTVGDYVAWDLPDVVMIVPRDHPKPEGARRLTLPVPWQGPLVDVERVSLAGKARTAAELCEVIAARSGKTVALEAEVEGRFGLTLRDVPWTRAVESVGELFGLEVELTGDGAVLRRSKLEAHAYGVELNGWVPLLGAHAGANTVVAPEVSGRRVRGHHVGVVPLSVLESTAAEAGCQVRQLGEQLTVSKAGDEVKVDLGEVQVAAGAEAFKGVGPLLATTLTPERRAAVIDGRIYRDPTTARGGETLVDRLIDRRTDEETSIEVREIQAARVLLRERDSEAEAWLEVIEVDGQPLRWKLSLKTD